MALKDREGVVQSSVIGLADCAKVSPDECRKALEILLSPDREDTSKVDEGRRIREVPGGWQLTNHSLYQFSTEERREYWRLKKAAERKKKAELEIKDLAETKGEQRVKEMNLGMAPGTLSKEEDTPF